MKKATMRTFATLKKSISASAKERILRNLNRIMAIVVLDVDIENSTITLLHADTSVLDKAKRELSCIGFPIQQLQVQQ